MNKRNTTKKELFWIKRFKTIDYSSKNCKINENL